MAIRILRFVERDDRRAKVHAGVGDESNVVFNECFYTALTSTGSFVSDGGAKVHFLNGYYNVHKVTCKKCKALIEEQTSA